MTLQLFHTSVPIVFTFVLFVRLNDCRHCSTVELAGFVVAIIGSAPAPLLCIQFGGATYGIAKPPPQRTGVSGACVELHSAGG